MDEPDKIPAPDEGIKYANQNQQLLIALGTGLVILLIITNDLFLYLAREWFYGPACLIWGCSMVMVTVTHFTSVFLDQRCRWEEQALRRLCLQFSFGCLFPFLLCSIVVYFYFWIMGIGLWLTHYFRFLAVLLFCILLLLNVAYFCCYLFYFFSNTLKSEVEPRYIGQCDYIEECSVPAEKYGTELSIKQARKEIKVLVNDIAYICCHGKHTTLLFHDADPIILYDTSLTHLRKRLDPDQFCLVNRSYMITIQSLIRYKKLTKGLELFLSPAHKEVIRVSYDNEAMVLNWIETRKSV